MGGLFDLLFGLDSDSGHGFFGSSNSRGIGPFSGKGNLEEDFCGWDENDNDDWDEDDEDGWEDADF